MLNCEREIVDGFTKDMKAPMPVARQILAVNVEEPLYLSENYPQLFHTHCYQVCEFRILLA